MKLVNKIVIILFLITLGTFAQQWRVAVTQSLPSISDAHFLNENIGFYVGDAGLVRKTIDGGLTWTNLGVAGSVALRRVYFVNELIGFVGDGAALIHKTTDGGLTWSQIPVTGGAGTVYGIHFTNENTGWVLTSTSTAGKLLYTSDGGVNWSVVVDNPAGDLEALKINGTTGIVCGGGVGKMDIYYSSNGTSWTKATPPTIPSGYTRTDFRAIHIQDANLIYLVGWGSLIGMQQSLHAKSTDGGVTWTYMLQQEQNKTFDNLWNVYFKDADNGVAIGGAIRGSVLVKTTDGGINWIPQFIPCGSSLDKIDGFGDVLIVTGTQNILKSTDFGATWVRLNAIPGTSLYGMHSIGNNFIVATGFDAMFIKSTDGGRTWAASTVRSNNVAPNAQDVFFVNENVGYVAHGYGLVSKTTNGGQSWFSVIKDTIANGWTNYGISFLNENYGFVVAKTSNNVDGIFKTTDGGATWDMKENVFATNLRGVAFVDENKGVVVGEKYKIGYTTDGGTTWSAASLPIISATPNFRDVFFINSNTVIAVGDAIMLASFDAGKTWSTSGTSGISFTETLTGLKFKDSMNGWAVGAKSTSPRSIALLQTTDAGVSWTNRVDYSVFDTMRTVIDLAYTINGDVYVCASQSTIYTNAVIDGIEKLNVNPTSFVLHQNYPNPFNPETTIRFEIISSDNVSLKIYDILGNEVAELVNEFMTPGTYSVRFNSTDINNKNIASGIYFYKLKTANNQLIKKMSLIK